MRVHQYREWPIARRQEHTRDHPPARAVERDVDNVGREIGRAMTNRRVNEQQNAKGERAQQRIE